MPPANDTGGAATVEDDPGDTEPGGDAQIAAVTRGFEIRDRRAAAPAVPGTEVIVANTFLDRAVEVVVARNVELIARGDDRFDQLVFSADGRTPHRTGEAVVGRVAVDGALEPLEVWQDIGVAPTVVARFRPVVVVLALAANRDQPVDRTRTAECLAARPVDPAAVHPGLGLGVEAPVHAGVEHGLGIPDGNVDPRIGVARPGFEQQHRMATVGGEPVGKNAAGGAGANDDVISRERGHGFGVPQKDVTGHGKTRRKDGVWGIWDRYATMIVVFQQKEGTRFDITVWKLLHYAVSSEGFPSGQREQTVNLPALPSKVRILPPPPGQGSDIGKSGWNSGPGF